jgi:hypothetical protein
LACESLGSSLIRNIKHRDSWCIIGEKGAENGSVPEACKPSRTGCTEIITRDFDLASRRKKMASSFPLQNNIRSNTSNHVLPSNGRWLRRRMNDGALNRVPTEFYPKVWSVLSFCMGIEIGDKFLPRDPTISEMTPEEVNFGMKLKLLYIFLYFQFVVT